MTGAVVTSVAGSRRDPNISPKITIKAMSRLTGRSTAGRGLRWEELGFWIDPFREVIFSRFIERTGMRGRKLTGKVVPG